MDPIELSRKIRGALAPCSLGGWPTPADVRPDLAAATGCAELWLKREDRSSTRGGGNKVRGLEFLLIGLPAGTVDAVEVVGTEVKIVQEGIPDVIPPEACTLGWQESLTLLAKLVEVEIPD